MLKCFSNYKPINVIDAEKPFDKIQQPFIIKEKKNPSESRHRMNIPQHNKSHLWQTHSKHYPQWWKLKAFPLKSGRRQGCPLSRLLFNIILEVLATAIRAEKKMKGIQFGKEVKLTVCRWHDPLYRNPKDTTRKLLALTNEYNKVAGYEINTEIPCIPIY